MSAEKKDDNGSSLSDLFEALSHEYRRRVLIAVAQQNPQDEDEIVSEATDDDHEDDEALEQLQLELYHAHLPKLDEAGFIDWDRESETITRGPRFEEIEPLLKLIHEHQDELPDGWP